MAHEVNFLYLIIIGKPTGIGIHFSRFGVHGLQVFNFNFMTLVVFSDVFFSIDSFTEGQFLLFCNVFYPEFADYLLVYIAGSVVDAPNWGDISLEHIVNKFFIAILVSRDLSRQVGEGVVEITPQNNILVHSVAAVTMDEDDWVVVLPH